MAKRKDLSEILTEENLRKWYVKEKLSFLKIAKIIGCQEDTVSRYAKKYNLKPRGPKKFNISKKWLYKQYCIEHLSLETIAKKVGCTYINIIYYLKKYNIDKRICKSNSSYFDIDKTLFTKYYYDDHMSLCKMAKKLKCTKHALEQYIYNNNLPENCFSLNKHWVKTQYFDLHKSFKDIKNHTKCTSKQLNRCLSSLRAQYQIRIIRRGSFKRIDDRLRQHGLQIYQQKHANINVGTKYILDIQCQVCKRIFKTRAETYLRGYQDQDFGCKKCKRKKYLDKFIGSKRHNLVVYSNNFYYDNSYKKRRLCIEVKCTLCNNIKMIKFNDWNRGKTKSCGCLISAGEQKCKDILNSIQCNPKWQTQKTFNNLFGCKNGKLKYDFYLQDLNVCIEYHGKQHYQTIKKFRGDEGFVKRLIHDQLKRNYCKTNNITLIEIPYTYFDDLETIIPQIINGKIPELIEPAIDYPEGWDYNRVKSEAEKLEKQNDK